MGKGKVIMLVLVLGVVGAGAFAALRPKPPESIEVVTGRAHRTEIVRRVQGVGHVEPVTKVRVSANVTGDLLALHVKEGDLVKRGHLLAEIDRQRILAQVRQSEASAKSAEANVALEEAERTRAAAEAGRVRKLHPLGLATDADADQAEANARVVDARLEGARQRVREARALLDQSTAQLDKTRIVAPIDGTVIALEKKVGERIRGSDLSEDVLLTLAPLQAMEVEVEISEQEIVAVQNGQRSEIVVDALGEAKIPGHVVEIASSAIVKNKGTEMETTTFRVRVALEQVPERLRSGMTASVSVVTESHPGALAVPIEAVTARLPSELKIRAGSEAQKRAQREDGDKALVDSQRRRERPTKLVFIVDKGLAEPRPVTIGISSDSELEILDGLAEGDEIVVGPYKALSRTLLPGSTLKITERLEDHANGEGGAAVATGAR